MTKRLLLLFFVSTGSNFGQDDHLAKFARVQAIFTAKCITCHAGSDAAAGMSLESGQAYQNIVNRPSNEDPELRRIAPNQLQNSYLYRKISQDREKLPFKEEPMPLEEAKLDEADIQTIADWINSFPEAVWGSKSASITSASSSEAPRAEEFLATQLINLPTTRSLGKKTFEFRIMHRFGPMNGDPNGGKTYFSFFGLDNGARTSINLAASLTNDIDILLRRTGYYKDIELGAKYIFFRSPGIFRSAGVYTSVDWISRKDAGGANRVSPNIQVLAGFQPISKLSILIAPSVAFKANHNIEIKKEISDTTAKLYKDTRATTAIGIGFQYEFKPNTALTGEFVPRISGYKGNTFAGDRRFDNWSLGFAHKIRLHVFEVLVSNAQSIHTGQYIPGSDYIRKNKIYHNGWNLHFGFNIYRQFKW